MSAGKCISPKCDNDLSGLGLANLTIPIGDGEACCELCVDVWLDAQQSDSREANQGKQPKEDDIKQTRDWVVAIWEKQNNKEGG